MLPSLHKIFWVDESPKLRRNIRVRTDISLPMLVSVCSICGETIIVLM
jgi:hypothetical protein